MNRKYFNDEKFDKYTPDATNNLLSPINEMISSRKSSQPAINLLSSSPPPPPTATTPLNGTETELTDVIGDNKHKNKWKTRISLILHAKLFHLIIVILCALDGLLVICMLLLEIESLKLKHGTLRSRLVMTSFIFECTSFAIVTLFLMEILIKLWAFGFNFYRHQWIEILDGLVCIVSFTVDTYNIHRHVTHSKDNENHKLYNDKIINETSNEYINKGVQETIADAAGLLVLFRLWRVIRIVNAIIVSVTASQERTVKCLKEAQIVSYKRIEQLEQLLDDNNIPIPPLTPRSKNILAKKSEK
ncbi:unnamed protein product [Heterobilharzia americana]|nr:unnamed protein product [Heterobilharzia americana]CAH8564027.1 unnamed protein product [Heterobilharzia americana]